VKELLIKIKALFDGSGADQAAASLRKVGDSGQSATGIFGKLKEALGQLAAASDDSRRKASKKQRAHRMTHGNTSGAVRMMATIQPNPRRVRPWSSCHRPGMTKFTIGGTLLINWNMSLGAFDVKREVYP
jgi:hypothetical protein